MQARLRPAIESIVQVKRFCLPAYSCLNVSTGSTRIALRAGI